MNRRVLMVATAAAASIPAYAQQLIPVQQDRWVSTGGFLDPCFDKGLEGLSVAESFSPFHERIERNGSCADSGARALLASEQDSRFEQRSIHLDSTTDAHLLMPEQTVNVAIAQSTLDASVQLSQAATAIVIVEFSGSARGTHASFWHHDVTVALDEVPVVQHDDKGDAEQDDIEARFIQSVDLESGILSIHAVAASAIDAPQPAGEHESHASQRVSIYIISQSCPADLNADDTLDADDFFLYLELFAAADPIADRNHDNAIDADDFFTYLNEFVAACP